MVLVASVRVPPLLHRPRRLLVVLVRIVVVGPKAVAGRGHQLARAYMRRAVAMSDDVVGGRGRWLRPWW